MMNNFMQNNNQGFPINQNQNQNQIFNQGQNINQNPINNITSQKNLSSGKKLSKYVKKYYAYSKSDLCNVMLEKGLDKCDISRRTTRVGDHPTSCVRGVVPENSIYKNTGEIVEKR